MSKNPPAPAWFVAPRSIVREIWGKSDTILFIFAGAAAEFALNKAVDWLYFTGRLPADPLGRLFSTVSYARAIVFADRASAERAIDAIAAIHARVEEERGTRIPDWAYRDVLFMLIDYSLRAFAVLERAPTAAEQREVFDVFYRVGHRMGVRGLPTAFAEWQIMRQAHLRDNLRRSHYTDDLFRQYRRHLGPVRYRLLLEAQRLVLPPAVADRMGFQRPSYLRFLVPLYRLSRRLRLDGVVQAILLPKGPRAELKRMGLQ